MTNYLLENLDLLNNSFYKFKTNNINLLKSDIKENDENYILEIEVPGFNKSDITISFEDKNLIVKASYKKDENVKYLLSERIPGTYSRSFYVGDVKAEHIKASFENGLLTITIDKSSYKEQEKTKFIEIN